LAAFGLSAGALAAGPVKRVYFPLAAPAPFHTGARRLCRCAFRRAQPARARRDFLGGIGARVYGDRAFVVCGVVLEAPLAVEPPDAHGVHTASVTWDEHAGYEDHPRADEFRRYLAWKRSFLSS
jgi:hypothetical protein